MPVPFKAYSSVMYNTTGPGNPNGPGITGTNTVWEDYYFEQESIKTIVDHNTSIPLFLFHAFHSIHTPLDPPSQMQEAWYPDVKDNTKRAYMTMVQYVDQAIGNIVDALKQKKMWENTIMLVASDNGGCVYQ
jgi:arylsulfatase A-like enzyme